MSRSKSLPAGYYLTLEKVRFLSTKHNFPKDTPEPLRPKLLPVQRLGWKANLYVLQLLKEIPLDSSNLSRCNGGRGTWVFRKQVNGIHYELNTQTTVLVEAIKIRDRELARIAKLHDNYEHQSKI